MKEPSRGIEEVAEAEAIDEVMDKLSIRQILEGMMNKFNEVVNQLNITENKEPKKIGNDAGNAEVSVAPNVENLQEVDEEKEKYVFEEAFEAEALALAAKESVKEAPKKSNIPRILLTFESLDELKTKISSCGRNLSLFPDESGNCDQIGRVSVEIENLDENFDAVDKNDEESKNAEETEVLSSAQQESEEQGDSGEDVDEIRLETDEEIGDLGDEEEEEVEVKRKEEEVKVIRLEPEQTEVTRKRRNEIRAPSLDSTPPKRSARRSCKKRINVLKSAMAMKERLNCTGDYKMKKNSEPGMPKLMSVADENAELNDRSDVSLASEINDFTDDNEVDIPGDTSEVVEEAHFLVNDYDEMPKLSPMVKSPEGGKGRELGNDNFEDGPFLGPAGKNRWGRKLGKIDSFEDVSNAVEAQKSNDYSEVSESNGSTKRTRKSIAPSSSPAEGQAAKPESTVTSSESNEKTMLCLCQARSQLYVTITGSGDPVFCTAMESIDDRLIGCCNQVNSNDTAMRRPSTRVPFNILCRSHKERLFYHNCCPVCGLFCTQGNFIHCNDGHQYHADCEVFINNKSVCPHCGNDSPNNNVQISLTGTRKPVYISPRKELWKLPSAKMSLPGRGDNTKLAARPPSPLVKPENIRIPEPSINTDRPERYTIMSLYTAVKDGDLEKLVNVLASGYDANYTYRTYSQRTGLHLAAECGYLDCVHALVQAGAQLDVMDENELTPLMIAATEGTTEVVRYLVRAGANVMLKGEGGMTALHRAAKSGHLETCRIILSECKVPKTLIDSVDIGGWTSLIWACEFCHTEVARFLLEKKCDPLIRDVEQNIALHWSAYSGSSETTEMLLNEGCDVNAVNVYGDTPLHIAARQDQYAVSVVLLARGAKIGEVNVAGETPLDCCPADSDTMLVLKLSARVNKLSDKIPERTIRILTNDISRGKETNPIQCVNGYDNEDEPTDFHYITHNCFTSNINVDRTITSLQSCHCEDNCSSEKCLCGNMSRRCWYDEKGKLIPEFDYADPPKLFECNQACACNQITCNNRVVQRGLTQRFQLFRTERKGWGLRTLRAIPQGSYVCEYVGEIISDSEANSREDDSYLLDIDNRGEEIYCIDARRYGNLARFINHSCAPNLRPIDVFVEHQDLRFPRVAYFANRDIAADEELGSDYGENFWIVKCKSFTCICGAINCRYSAKTIQDTLNKCRRKK